MGFTGAEITVAGAAGYFAVFGTGFVFRPAFVERFGLHWTDAAGKTEVRCYYGAVSWALSGLLIYLLAHDEKHAAANRQLFKGWLKKHRALADKAALGLQPIWSMPHSKPVSFEDVRAVSQERIGQILRELGLDD